MSEIRVQCNGCGSELSLPASSAGKSGRCPKCQTIFSIPGNHPVQTAPVQPGSAAPAQFSSASDGGVGANPYASQNPYNAPTHQPPGLHSIYDDHNPPPLGLVTTPLIIAGVIYVLIGIVVMLVMLAVSMNDRAAIPMFFIGAILGGFSIALGCFMFFVAAKVRKRKKWAWIAAIVFGGMFTPSAFFFLGIPILIGALKPEVSGWINQK